MYQDGKEKKAKAVLQLSENEPNISIVPYTPEKVLALILDCGLFKGSYRKIRLGVMKQAVNCILLKILLGMQKNNVCQAIETV